MVKFGILERKVLGDKSPVKVEYRLTSFGSKFKTIIDEIEKLQRYLDNSST